MSDSVRDAEPLDIFVDECGKLWRVVGIIGEPALIVEEVERADGVPAVRRTGGMSGLMWTGWRRIFRPAKEPREPRPINRNSSAGWQV